MASYSCLLGFLTVCGVCAVSFAFLDHDEELIAAREKVQYHFQELKKSVDSVSDIQRRSTRTKREVHLRDDMRKSDFLFDSLLHFCVEIQNFTGNFTPEYHNVNKTSVPKTPQIPQFNDADDSNWLVPEVRPIGVTASRDGDRVHFLFYVKHSAPARIRRFAGVEYQQIDIELDESASDGPETSSASFTANQISSYCITESSVYANQFIFEKKGDLGIKIYVVIDACKFDKYRDKSIDWYNRTWITKPGPLHENVTSSKILTVLPPTDGIVVENGKNQSLEVTAEMDTSGYIHFYAVFYDRSTRKLNSNQYVYYAGARWSQDVVQGGKTPGRFFHVEEISSVPTDGKETSDNYEGTRRVKLRVTLATASGRITGKLYISIREFFRNESNPSVVGEVMTELRYLIKKPNRANVFPRRQILMEEENRFICSDMGNERHERFGRNCTIACWASGRDLDSLKISRNGSEVTGYGYLSYVADDRIFTRIDLGRSSPALDGTYECKVSDKRSFIKTQKINVFSYGFPKVDQYTSGVDDLGNGTSLVTCNVTGSLPINVSFELNQDQGYLETFDKSAWSQNDTETAFGKIVQVALPTNDIRYPVYSVGCRASSDRGYDYESFELRNVVSNYTLNAAKILPRESGIVSFYDNLTTVITCAASGRQPLDVWVAFEDRTFRVDNETEYSREEFTTEDRTMVRMSGDSKAMKQATYWVYCVAKNVYDTDYLRYYLWNYLDTRLIIN